MAMCFCCCDVAEWAWKWYCGYELVSNVVMAFEYRIWKRKVAYVFGSCDISDGGT